MGIKVTPKTNEDRVVKAGDILITKTNGVLKNHIGIVFQASYGLKVVWDNGLTTDAVCPGDYQDFFEGTIEVTA